MTTDRIKKIQESTAYPSSQSVQQALLQVWNECAQQSQIEIDELTKEVERLRFKENQLGQIHDIVDKQNFDEDSREYEIFKILNENKQLDKESVNTKLIYNYLLEACLEAKKELRNMMVSHSKAGKLIDKAIEKATKK